jgi:hypothetical protein
MPDGNLLPHGKVEPSNTPLFNFTEWWNIGEGEMMREPFDVRDEVVVGLLHALEEVCTLVSFTGPQIN